jgi:hypothetical protein
LLRERGQVSLASPHLELYVPARMWDEAKVEMIWADGAYSGEPLSK